MSKQFIHYIHRMIHILLAASIPYIGYLIMKHFNRNGGAAATTSVLKDFGFNISMEMGLKVLFLISVVSFVIYDHLLIQYYRKKIETEINARQLNNVSSVLQTIDSYNISNILKSTLKSYYL